MKPTTKILTLLLALCLMLGALFACASKNEKPVGTCGDCEILYDELRFHALRLREKHPSATEDELQDAVADALCHQYAVLSLCKEYLPDLTVEDEKIQEAVDQAIESAITSQGGKSAYKKMLKERYLSKNLMRRLLAVSQMQIELEKVIYRGTELENADTFASWLTEGNCVRARRVFFPSTFTRADVDQARLSLLGGASPDTLLSKEQLLGGAVCYQPDYYFRELNGTELEAAALALDSVGGVSAVVEDTNGYSILIRVENDFETLLNYQKEVAFNRYREQYLNALLDQAAKELSFVKNAYGKEIELLLLD